MAQQDHVMDNRTELICLLAGYAFLPLYVIGFAAIAGFIPIQSPDWDAPTVVTYFAVNRDKILIGMSISVVASALYIPWSVAIFARMYRMEAAFPVLSYVQLASGAVGSAFFMIPPMLWITMVFRLGHSPDVMVMFNDFAWIAWIISWPLFFLQNACFGLSVLLDRAEHAPIPRWAGYFVCFSTLSLFPASLIAFFKTGPLAWNGVIAVYLPLGLYAICFHVILYVLFKALKERNSRRVAAPFAPIAAQ